MPIRVELPVWCTSHNIELHLKHAGAGGAGETTYATIEVNNKVLKTFQPHLDISKQQVFSIPNSFLQKGRNSLLLRLASPGEIGANGIDEEKREVWWIREIKVNAVVRGTAKMSPS